MRWGFRKPSIRKRIAARTSWKRYVRHNLGFKAPRGWGWLTNPRRAAYKYISDAFESEGYRARHAEIHRRRPRCQTSTVPPASRLQIELRLGLARPDTGGRSES